MSRIAGNQQGSRKDRDFYPTDRRWTEVLCREVPLPKHIWEPAAGDGAIAQVLQESGHEVTGTDISTGEDFLTSVRRSEAIVTNPPYSLLDEFIVQGLRLTDGLLCLLVGWHFVAGGVRRATSIWQVNPPARVLVVADRMPILNSGRSSSALSRKPSSSSQYNHAWVVWDVRRPAIETRLSWHRVGEPQRDGVVSPHYGYPSMSA